MRKYEDLFVLAHCRETISSESGIQAKWTEIFGSEPLPVKAITKRLIRDGLLRVDGTIKRVRYFETTDAGLRELDLYCRGLR